MKIEQNFQAKTVKQFIHEEDTVFSYADFYDLKNNSKYDRFFTGELKLPSGKIICTDPLYRELVLPQSWSVVNKVCPVYLYIGLEGNFNGRVCYAELLFSEQQPLYWELSLIPEELLADSFEKMLNGMYPVENGLSCFADVESFKEYENDIANYYKEHPEGSFYLNVLEPYFSESMDIPKSSRGGDWANYQTSSNGNIIMFGSGFGDGIYPRYVGFDKERNVVCLITDFTRTQ